MNCNKCGIEIKKDEKDWTPYSSFGSYVFCSECGLHVVSYRKGRDSFWEYIPIGKKPVYKDGVIVAIIDQSASCDSFEDATKKAHLTSVRKDDSIKVKKVKKEKSVNVNELVKIEADKIVKENETTS